MKSCFTETGFFTQISHAGNPGYQARCATAESRTIDFVQPCPDNAFDWIRNGRKEHVPRTGPEWVGNCVTNLMPPEFGAYAKILHGIEANYEHIDNPLSDRENAILNIPKCDKLKSFITNLRKERQGTRIRWRELSDLFGVPFKTEICLEWFRTTMDEPSCWGRLLYGPGEGQLNSEELAEIVPILRHFANGQDCFFRFSEIAFIATGKPLLFHGPLDELTQFLEQGQYQITPEYWWPADRTWCLCSDWDLKFTFVGGSNELVSLLQNSHYLEVFEAAPTTRVDNFAPISR